MTAIHTCRVFRPDPESLDANETHHRARFTARRLSESTVVVTIEGEIDATNDRALARFVERHVAGSAHLVLDLRLVDFFGTAGFAALHNVNVICTHHSATWVMQADRRVRRLLAICDPDATLPLEKPQSVLDHLNAGTGDREFLIRRDN
jgi:anti-anti-sigma factor